VDAKVVLRRLERRRPRALDLQAIGAIRGQTPGFARAIAMAILRGAEMAARELGRLSLEDANCSCVR
jgi:hypothetical protein